MNVTRHAKKMSVLSGRAHMHDALAIGLRTDSGTKSMRARLQYVCRVAYGCSSSTSLQSWVFDFGQLILGDHLLKS